MLYETLHDAWFRLRALVGRSAQKAAHDEELRFHVEQQVAKYVNSGMTPDEAARRARLQFGSVDRAQEECWEARGVSLLEGFAQDVRYAGRTLWRSRWFTLCAVLTLALGIGANTAIFTVVNSVLLNPLPYPNPQELLAARHNDSLQNIQDTLRQSHSFAAGGGINVATMDYTGGSEPVHVRAAQVSAGFLQALGVTPMMGRLITSSEDVKGGPRNIVISYSLWRNFLGADPDIVGKSIPLSGNSYTVIGVMPRDFSSTARAGRSVCLTVGGLSRGRRLSRRAFHEYLLAAQAGRESGAGPV